MKKNLLAADGKMRKPDCANTEGLFRIIQFLVLILVIIWTYQFTLLWLPEQRISVYSVTKALVIAIMINLGLWLSTQKFGKKYKYLTLFFMLPAIMLNPIIMFSENIIICIVLASIINIIAIFLLFRKDVNNAKNHYSKEKI